MYIVSVESYEPHTLYWDTLQLPMQYTYPPWYNFQLKGENSMLYMILILSIICLSYFIYLAYKNTKDIKINKIKINSNNFTASNKPLSILHLSDLHLENISLSANQLKDKLANESVDLIALTGDFLDRKRTIPKLIPYLRVLNDLNPKHGMYAVFGN